MRLIQTLSLLALMLALTLMLACSAEVDTETKAEGETQMAAEVEGAAEVAEEAEMAVEAVAWNTVCPVEGGQIDPAVAAFDFEGKQYGFCCTGCDEKFKAEPAKFAKNLSEDGTQFLQM